MYNVIDYRTMKDIDGNVFAIETLKGKEHYMVYVNTKFWASAENRQEVDEEIQEIIKCYYLTY